MGTIDLIKKIPVKYWIISIIVSLVFFVPLWFYVQWVLEEDSLSGAASVIFPTAVIVGFVVSAFMTAGGLYYKEEKE